MVSSVLASLLLYVLACNETFWTDELYSVSSIRSSLNFSDTVNIYATFDRQSPLFPFLTYFWYRLVPHTESALLIICIFFAVMSSIVTGLIGKKLYGERFGIFAFIFAVTNYSVMNRAALDFKPYSLLVLISSVNIYFYLCRLKNENWKNIGLYGISMGLLPWTHYLSVLVCFGIFISDCVLIMKKRAGVRIIISYILGALVFTPWLVILMKNFNLGTFLSFWPQVPNLRSILELGKSLTGSGSFLAVTFLAALCGFLIIMAKSYRFIKDNEIFSYDIIFMNTGLFTSFFMIMMIYIYSAYINPNGSCFVERYFYPLIPVANLFMAYGTDYMYCKLKPSFGKRTSFVFLVLFLMIYAVNFSRSRNHFINEPYKEVSALIRSYEAEYDSNRKSAIITTDTGYLYYGLEEFYLSEDHKYNFNIPAYCLSRRYYKEKDMPVTELLNELQKQRYNRIYLLYLHTPLKQIESSEAVLKYLRENYIFSERIEDYKFQILERRK